MPRIDLSEISTRAPEDLDKLKTKEKLATILPQLDELQNLLYASARYSILIVIQGMDASGKDGLTRKVFSRMNPQGVNVTSFKAPLEDELAHDFLWRVHKHTPAKGMIQIFNRSHYEDVLITRVHGLIDDDTAKLRMRAINGFERLLLEDNETQIIKFYLHISPEEQMERLKERTSDPTKMWKYNENDFKETKNWKKYMECYEEVFEHCNEIPWQVIPADQNWYKEYLVAQRLLEVLQGLDMRYPGLKRKS
jgi:PPK2 family polyphosphate:nucleotide phosphotransferase